MKHYSNIVPADEVSDARLPDFALFLDLAGPLRLTDATGADLTPNARKAQGLLALIATAPGMRRSRIWLQDKLWSESDQTQGAASLRQCLLRLRAALGNHADCIKVKAGWIGFDPARVRVRTHLHATDLDEGEFLEGLDICDPEFEDWLREQRMSYAERSRKTVTVPEAAVDAPRMTHGEIAALCVREHVGAMVAAAALAGYLMQRRDPSTSGVRLLRGDLLEALRSGHVPYAHEIVRAITPLLAPGRRETCGRGVALHRH